MAIAIEVALTGLWTTQVVVNAQARHPAAALLTWVTGYGAASFTTAAIAMGKAWRRIRQQ
ncbi:MAG: hypothetical protein ACREVE_08495 [Gammaproteobacteria bacterium]